MGFPPVTYVLMQGCLLPAKYEWTVWNMRLGRYRTKNGKIPLATIFVAGLFLGMLILNFGKSILLDNTGLLDEYTLYHMKYMTVDSSALFYYVLRNRLVRVLGLAVLSTTYLGMAVCVGCVFWYGMCSGIFLSAAVIRYGIKGILLVLAGIFPQYLIYVPMMIFLLLWCQRLYRMIYVEKNSVSGLDKSRFLPKVILELGGVLLALLAGCVVESFLNPYLVIGLLKIF